MITQLQEDVVVGPVDDPRYGKSIRIRPTIETQRAGRFPSQAVVVTAAARRLISLARENEKIKAIIVEGDDFDPTMHGEFHEISENLRELTNKHFPKAKLVLVSDRPQLDRPRSRHALVYYDKPIVRLEAGYQKTFQALTGEEGNVFKERVENMNRLELERLVVHATFVRGPVDNSGDREVKAWLKHITDIKPAEVRIDTAAKPEIKGTKPITKTRITEIADLVTEAGISVDLETP